MYVLDMLEKECLQLAIKLNDTLYKEECQQISTTNISTSVIEFAASILIAQLSYLINPLT